LLHPSFWLWQLLPAAVTLVLVAARLHANHHERHPAIRRRRKARRAIRREIRHAQDALRAGQAAEVNATLARALRLATAAGTDLSPESIVISDVEQRLAQSSRANDGSLQLVRRIFALEDRRRFAVVPELVTASREALAADLTAASILSNDLAASPVRAL
jgi:hypothetical protein